MRTVLLHANNGHVVLPEGRMDYIRFGTGKRTMVMIPGVGDGLKTVRGMALPFALLYRQLAGDFTVYVFSRREPLAPSMDTRDMAEDLALAMDRLGLSDASVVGVSQGGMIAQWLAIDHPERVSSLVLVVTLARPNPVMKDVIRRWLKMAKEKDYQGIMLDTAERAYSPSYLKKARITYRLLGNLGKPRSFRRFMIQARSCATHNAYEDLSRIKCPTLVIGGSDDRIVTGHASEEICAGIPGAKLKMYDGLGHGLYEEAPDFLTTVRSFCLRDWAMEKS